MKEMIANGSSPNIFYKNAKNENVYMDITCAGMPSKCYEHVTWENFMTGNSFEGKLQPAHVPGGIVLKRVDFTIKA